MRATRHRGLVSGFFPPVSFKARTVVELHEVRLCSTNLAILLREWLLAHWEWRDGENSVYPHGNGLDWWSTVFSGGADPFLF